MRFPGGIRLFLVPIVISILLLAENVFGQAGKDGAKIVNSVVNVNVYTTLTANGVAGSTTLNVASSNLSSAGIFSSPLSQGDLLFIIQVQGIQISTIDDSTFGSILNIWNCGNHEFVQVASVPNATSITLSCALKKNYDAGGRVQVVRVPRYSSLTINGTGSVTCPAWNGATGGVLAMEVQGNTIINTGGNIDVNGKGFRGGALAENASWWGVNNHISPNTDYGAEKGEGIAGNQTDYDAMGGRYSKGAPANGGGGANAHNAGGGGGANAGNVSSWTGRGNPDISNATWAAAWNLEYAGFATSTSTGGGRGGFTFSGSNQNALTTGPSNAAWGGDARAEQGGRGGRPLSYATGKIFMGGGGGAGDQNNNAGGVGGAGGGIAYLLAYGDVSGGGVIRANGVNGANSNGTDGAGGGGGGGTVLVPALGNISGISISANAGGGGNQSVSFGTLEAEGPGGGGGGGYIGISNGAITRSAAGGANGTTNSISLTEFPANGATRGGSGESTAILPTFKINVNSPQVVCVGSPATLTFTTTGTAPAGTNLGWYTSSIGGTLLGTGNTYTTAPITGNTILYIGSCPGVYRQPVVLNANLLTSSFSSTTVCESLPTVFSATGNSSLGTISSWAWNFGDGIGTSTIQNPSYTYTTSGTFSVTLTVTDDKGCTSVTTNQVVVNPRPTINFSALPAIGCLPLQVQFTNTSSNASNYTWNFGDGSAVSFLNAPAHNYTTSGSYSVTLSASNASGCTRSQTMTNLIQTSPSPKSIFSASASSVCIGDTIDFSDLSLPNGTTIISRSWDFDDGTPLSTQTNPSHVYMSPGTYDVKLTVSSSSCSHDTTLTILVNPGPVVNFSSSLNSGCNPLTVSFSNNTTGAPSYSWNFGDGSSLSSAVAPVHTYASAGTYSVTLIATQGSCADTLRIQSMVVVYPMPNASFTAPTSVCLGDTVFFANNSTGNGGITGYRWNFGDGSATSLASNPYHIYNAAGSYQVTLSCSTNQCIDEMIQTVVIAPAPQVAFSPSVTSGCAPLNVSFTNSTTGTANYAWNFGDGGTSTGTTPSHIYNAPGSYPVTLIATQGSCADTLSILNLISVAAKPTASFSAASSLCSGDTLFTQNSSNWNGTNPGTFTWNFGDGSATSNLTNPYHIYQSGGTYTVTLTASTSACSDDSSFSVNIAPAPQAAFTASATSACTPSSILFTNNTGGNPVFTWNFGDNSAVSNQVNPSHTYSSSGNYSVTLIATQGSCADTLVMPALINILPTPLANFSFSAACVNDSIQFTNTTLAQGSTISSYSWDFGDGSSLSSLQNPKHAYSSSGNYTVILSAQSSNGCLDTIHRIVSVLARPQVSFIPNVTSGCDSVTVIFNNTSIGASTYDWTFGDGTISNLQSPTHTYTTAGTYSVLLTAEATGGCSASRAYVNLIVVRNTPIVNFSSTASGICPGECVRFQDLSSSTVNSWSWSFPGANPSTAANSSPASVCYPTQGTYEVSLTVSDGFCSATKIVQGQIDVVDCSSLPVASFMASDSSVCGGVCVSFVSLSLNSTSWAWSFPGATPSSSLDESPQNICYSQSGDYTVSLITLNLTGSDTLLMNNFIHVFPDVIQPTFSQYGDSLLSSLASSYQWYLNGVPISGANDQLLIASLSGNYSVEIHDANSCTSMSDSKFVSLVGIEEEISNTYLQLYPIPCENELRVYFFSLSSEKLTLSIFNALGALVITETVNADRGENTFEINTRSMASGIYWLRVRVSDRYFLRKIVRR
ncbi:MAG: PKD domain-containing protein [Bacteroidia bacterium]|nr:PKD domain-containing protein [Bacteroidia bacterium]